jgi:hypothetical protein
MPIINARTRGKHFMRFVSSLEEENHEALCAYAAFIGEPPNYVLNQLIDGVLATDPDYRAWRAQHPESFVVPRQGRQTRRRRRTDGRSRDRVNASAIESRDIPLRDA